MSLLLNTAAFLERFGFSPKPTYTAFKKEYPHVVARLENAVFPLEQEAYKRCEKILNPLVQEVKKVVEEARYRRTIEINQQKVIEMNNHTVKEMNNNKKRLRSTDPLTSYIEVQSSSDLEEGERDDSKAQKRIEELEAELAQKSKLVDQLKERVDRLEIENESYAAQLSAEDTVTWKQRFIDIERSYRALVNRFNVVGDIYLRWKNTQ